MDVLLLGPLQVSHAGDPVDLGPRRAQRCLLGLLLLDACQAIQLDRLADLLWDGNPPDDATGVIRSHVSRLRATLDPRRNGDLGIQLLSHGSAYEARLDPESVDAIRFKGLVAAAEQTPDPAARAVALREALALWRGPVLSDVASDRLRDRVGASLAELRLHAWESCLDAELEAGLHHRVIPELTSLTREHPTRERLVGSLMLALYRSGRASQALDEYRTCRATMIEELGIEPTPELQRLHQRMLSADPDLAGAGSKTGPAQQLRFLPRDVPDFVGRAAGFAWLDGLAEGTANAAVITAVAGTAGVGKTALAVRWAHRAAQRFPDGQLYVNLRGYDHRQPLRPIEALSHLLRCLGTPAEMLPTNLDDASAQFRAAVAGKRILILLDNARTAKQVRPMLPGDPHAFVLVTSRDLLSGLVAHDGVKRLDLGLLSPQEGLELLRRLVGDRVDAEPQAASTLVTLCAHLPLALRIAAAQLSDRPQQTLGDYVAELSGGQRLAALSVDGDEDLAVRAVLDQSYSALSAPDQRLFRLLGAIPGPDFSVDAVTALAGLPAAEALDRLAAGHLLERAGRNRFTFHDLIRDYACLRLAEGDSDADDALRRLLNYFREQAASANAIITSGQGAVGDAMDWLEAERANLVDAIATAAAKGWAEVACDIAQPLWRFFHHAGHTTDWITTFECVVEASEPSADEFTKAFLLNALGGAYLKAARYAEATRIHEQCVQIRQRIGDHDGVARSRANLALAFEHQGRYDDALEQVKAAIQLCHDTGNTAFELMMLSGSLVTIYIQTGRYEIARDILLQAMPRVRAQGTPHDVCRALHNLSEACRFLGEPQQALGFMEEAVAVQRDLGNAHGVGLGLCQLGSAHRDLGDHTKAISFFEQGLEMVRDAGMRAEENEMLNEFALTLLAAGDDKHAEEVYRQSAALAEQIGTKHYEARAHLGLHRSLRQREPDAAEHHLGCALALLDEINPAEAQQIRLEQGELLRGRNG